MRLYVTTPTPEFANDMADEARVFAGAVSYAIVKTPPDDADGLFLCHTEEKRDGQTVCCVSLRGALSADAEQSFTESTDALIQKRLHKRALKLAVYDCFREATGRTPPWGSLTGIRPTRILYAQMNAGASLDEAARFAGDVFGVQPQKLSLLKEIITVQQTLPAPKTQDADIYIGIPFCVTRCAYCSFLSGELGDGHLAAPYTDALLKEIELTKQLIQAAGLTVNAVYIGGGTPTALPSAQLRRVLNAAAPLADGREFTVEAGRPDTMDEEKLAAIRDAGATRISINPQTKHDATLRLIGRAHTKRQTEEAYALARRMGFGHINMDLIAGLPDENEEMFAQTLAWAESLHPESLTVHTLSIKRSSLLHLWQAKLPDGEMVGRMVDMGRAKAHEMGMRAYYLYRQKYMAGNLENVGYAKAGHACGYNVRMMEETGNVLALGAGGISKRVYRDGGRIARAPNVSNIEQYIERIEEMAERKRNIWKDKTKA